MPWLELSMSVSAWSTGRGEGNKYLCRQRQGFIYLTDKDGTTE